MPKSFFHALSAGPASRSRRRFLRHSIGAYTALRAGSTSAKGIATEKAETPQSGVRLALLVCCGRYPDGRNILPAAKNGRDLEVALRRQGFLVEVENNLDLKHFSAAVDRFKSRMTALPADGKNIGLIYFCGHGMQVEGHNYLLPSDVATDNPQAKELSIDLQEQVLAAFPQRYPGLGVAVIDACRDNNEPGTTTSSFNYSSAPTGCIVAFSASAGQVSLSPSDPDKNSFYTHELVGVLNEIDDETPISDIFELTRLRVEKTMANHPAAIVRKLAQRPHITTGQVGDFTLGRIRNSSDVRTNEDDAYTELVAAYLPGEVKAVADSFIQRYPKSRYTPQVVVALTGANDALKALDSPFLRLSRSAFQPSAGDEYFGADMRKALRGDKDAAARVSSMYRKGSNGVSQNPQRGEQWLRFSALLGNAIACYELYRSLAERGDPDAEYFGPEAIRLGYRPPKALCSGRKSESC